MINRIHQQSITPQIFKFQIFKYTPHIFKNQSIVKQRVITILSTCPAPAGTSAIFRGVSMLYASFLSCRSCLHVLAGWLQTLHSCKATTPLYPPWEKHFPCKQNSCSFPGGGIAIPDCDNPPHTHTPCFGQSLSWLHCIYRCCCMHLTWVRPHYVSCNYCEPAS